MANPIKLLARMDPDGNAQAEVDAATQESITRYSAVILDEDFIGAGHLAAFPTAATSGYPWVAKIVGAAPPTVGVVANQPGGVVAITLAATSEPEDAILYAGDSLNYDLTKYASIETRLALQVLPTALVEMVWGFRSPWITGGPDNAATYVDFQVLASGAVNCRIKDGVSSAQSFAATVPAGTTNLPSGLAVGPVTLVAAAFHNFRIDVSDPTNVLFWIDGVRVSPGQPSAPMTFAATGAAAVMQPYFACFKASGTGIGTMYVDMVQASMNRA